MGVIIAIMAMMLMMALGTALILTTSTESKIVMNFRNSSEAAYAADAALERAMDDLLTVPDWNTLLSGATTSAFVDGAPTGIRHLADGKELDLGEVLNFANCQKPTCSPSEYVAVTLERPWGPNNPVWQLYAYGKLNDLTPTGSVNSPFYVVVMVADDPSENDGDPRHDGVSPDNPIPGPAFSRCARKPSDRSAPTRSSSSRWHAPTPRSWSAATQDSVVRTNRTGGRANHLCRVPARS